MRLPFCPAFQLTLYGALVSVPRIFAAPHEQF
jgi:hypothetical protein